MKKAIRQYGFVLVVVILLMTLFTYYDLPISIYLYNKKSIFGSIFEMIGEWPAPLITSVCGAVLMLYHKGQGRIKKIFFTLCGGALWLWCVFVSAFYPLMYLNKVAITAVIFNAAVVGIASIFLAGLIPEENREKAQRAALVGAILFVSLLITVSAVKLLWGRQRFFSMKAPYDEYSPWYVMHGGVEDNNTTSFPSGHTANASVVLVLTLIPSIFPKTESKKTLIQPRNEYWVRNFDGDSEILKKPRYSLLNLLTIAAVLSQYEVQIIDERIDGIDFNEPRDLVCISVMTCDAPRAYEIAEVF